MKKSKGIAEDFWNDCTDNQISSSFEPFSKMISYNKYAKNYGRNTEMDILHIILFLTLIFIINF
jgi:hypothetical protein